MTALIYNEDMECRLCDENKNSDALWTKKGKYWNVHVCWFQHTLGSLGIILKRHVESFIDLTPEEISELGQLLQESQKILSDKLNPDWFNIQLNANWHHHLHFLLLPRYKETQKFNGKEYADNNFGDPIAYTREEEQEETRKLLTGLLK